MARIPVQKAVSEKRDTSKRELYATVCYFFPQYTLQEVQNLPYRDIKLLLKIARRQEAAKMHNLTLIAQAPHSKKQSNVKKLIDHFKKLMDK